MQLILIQMSTVWGRQRGFRTKLSGVRVKRERRTPLKRLDDWTIGRSVFFESFEDRMQWDPDDLRLSGLISWEIAQISKYRVTGNNSDGIRDQSTSLL